MRPNSPIRHCTRASLLALLLACVLVGGLTSGRATGATTGSVVGANVLSATSISVAGCLPGVAGRTAFGLVPGGSSNITSSDCTLGFGSSNDTASLRVAQLDGAGAAMAAAPDRLQTSWASGGISTFANPVAGTQALGISSSIMQPDGKVIAVGSTFAGGIVQSVVYRRNIDGSLDTAGFNAPNGYVAFDAAPTRTEELKGVDLQADGKIVAVGWADTGGVDRNGTIVRVNANGTLDTTFGGGGTGWRVVDLGGAASGESYMDVAAEAAGTIVAFGQDDLAGIDDHWVLDRYTSLGVPDPGTGGGSGRVVINPTVNHDSLHSIAPLPGGGYLVGGQSQPGAFVGHVTKVDATLNVDATWGAAGHRQVNIVAFYEDVVEIEVLSDGSALLAIDQSGGGSNHAIVAKLTPAGALDTGGFANPNGFVEAPSSANIDHTTAIEVSSSGLIYVSYNVSAATLGIARITAAGAVDTSFGTNGANTSIPVQNPGIRSLHITGGSLVLLASNAATINDSMVRLGGLEVDDYLNLGGGSDRDWTSGPTTNLFGTCLRDVTVATADWVVDGNTDCTVSDLDPWRAVPALTSDVAAKVAHTTVAGQSATAMLRFAFRPSTSLPAGLYEAPLAIEVVAPQS